MLGIHKNGITVAVVQLPYHKHESLCVMLDDRPNEMIAVASFTSLENAAWFKEILEEMFSRGEETRNICST